MVVPIGSSTRGIRNGTRGSSNWDLEIQGVVAALGELEMALGVVPIGNSTRGIRNGTGLEFPL